MKKKPSRKVPFYDNKGRKRMSLPGNLTIEKLVAMGISFKIVPEEHPLPDDEVSSKRL
jgi:hypothetical protein